MDSFYTKGPGAWALTLYIFLRKKKIIAPANSFYPVIILYLCAPSFDSKNVYAAVVELVDTHVSGACGRKAVRVRIPPAAHIYGVNTK